MIKYATAIRQGTASTEAILRRFTRSASPHLPGDARGRRAQRTIFVACYLRDRDLQREITEGLNVIAAFNGANSVIYYGKGGEITSKTSWPRTSGRACSAPKTVVASLRCSGSTCCPTAR